MSISSNLTKLTTDITNAYTSIENKGGTIPANKNTNNLSTAIDSIQSSNIIGATAEGESISLANTKAMPYSDYVVEGKSEQDGEPSPSNPSEIHSVADDVNLFDVSTVFAGDIKRNNSTIRLCSGQTIYLQTGTYTFSTNAPNPFRYAISTNNIGTPPLSVYPSYIYDSGWKETGTYPSLTFTITTPGYLAIQFSKTNDASITVNEILQYYWKLQKGSIATPYSPYNQGTVTIKQRGKNLLPFTNQDFTVNNVRYYVQDGSLYFNGTVH